MKSGPRWWQPTLAALLVLQGCAGDRPRPDPVTPDDVPVLTAQVLLPAPNSVVATTTTIEIRVEGRDLNRNGLVGVGYAIQRRGLTISQSSVHFTARTDSTVSFNYVIPDMPTNTQLDIYGISTASNGESVISEPASVVVARCAELPTCANGG